MPLPPVLIEFRALFEFGIALVAGEGALASVDSLVDLQVRGPGERFAAHRAAVGGHLDAWNAGGEIGKGSVSIRWTRLDQEGPEDGGGHPGYLPCTLLSKGRLQE